MKKGMIGMIAAAALVAMQTVTVFASVSKVAAPNVSGDSAGKYTITAGTNAETFSEVKNEALVSAILKVNKGTASLSEAITAAPATREAVQAAESKSALTEVFDLEKIGSVSPVNGKYKVSFVVSTLTKSTSNVVLLHFSIAKNTWELVTPDNVDIETKTITASFDDLSPVVVLADVPASSASENQTDSSTKTTSSGKTGKTGKTGTSGNQAVSPKTGVDSFGMEFAAAGLVLGAAGLILRKKSA